MEFTPSRNIQKMVNKNKRELIGKPDPALPGKSIKGTLQADHIVSMDRISRMDGFEKLTREQKLEVLNNPENFIGLSETANKSKGSKTYFEWTVYKKENIKVDPDFRGNMIDKEQQLEILLQKQIDDFNK